MQRDRACGDGEASDCVDRNEERDDLVVFVVTVASCGDDVFFRKNGDALRVCVVTLGESSDEYVDWNEERYSALLSASRQRALKFRR